MPEMPEHIKQRFKRKVANFQKKNHHLEVNYACPEETGLPEAIVRHAPFKLGKMQKGDLISEASWVIRVKPHEDAHVVHVVKYGPLKMPGRLDVSFDEAGRSKPKFHPETIRNIRPPKEVDETHHAKSMDDADRIFFEQLERAVDSLPKSHQLPDNRPGLIDRIKKRFSGG